MPSILGSDGCGIIIRVGDGLDKKYIGRKVAFYLGTWSTYAVKDFDFIILLADN